MHKTASGPSVRPWFCLWVPEIQPDRTLTSLIVTSSYQVTSFVQSWPCGGNRGHMYLPDYAHTFGERDQGGTSGPAAVMAPESFGRRGTEQLLIVCNGASQVRSSSYRHVSRSIVTISGVLLIRVDLKNLVS